MQPLRGWIEGGVLAGGTPPGLPPAVLCIPASGDVAGRFRDVLILFVYATSSGLNLGWGFARGQPSGVAPGCPLHPPFGGCLPGGCGMC